MQSLYSTVQKIYLLNVGNRRVLQENVAGAYICVNVISIWITINNINVMDHHTDPVVIAIIKNKHENKYILTIPKMSNARYDPIVRKDSS
jgi:hypothetical protein